MENCSSSASIGERLGTLADKLAGGNIIPQQPSVHHQHNSRQQRQHALESAVNLNHLEMQEFERVFNNSQPIPPPTLQIPVSIPKVSAIQYENRMEREPNPFVQEFEAFDENLLETAWNNFSTRPFQPRTIDNGLMMNTRFHGIIENNRSQISARHLDDYDNALNEAFEVEEQLNNLTFQQSEHSKETEEEISQQQQEEENVDDGLARLAGEFIEQIAPTNAKLQQSKFVAWLHKIRDQQLIIEGNSLVTKTHSDSIQKR